MRKLMVGTIVERDGIQERGTGMRGIVIKVNYFDRPRAGNVRGRIQVRWQNLHVTTLEDRQLRPVVGACGCGLSVGPYAD